MLQDPEHPLQIYVGVYDAITAMAVSSIDGVDGLWLSSLGMSSARGLPDRNVLSVPEIVESSWSVLRSSALPVVVDVDNGLGTLDSAARLARELSAAGVAGICIEDNAYPKRNSLVDADDRRLASSDGFAALLATCAAALDGTRTRLIARTEALVAGESVASALDRGRRYADAGAHALVFHSVDPTGSQVLEAGERWSGECPLMAIPTAYPALSRATLAAGGFSTVIYANQVLRGIIRASQLTTSGLLGSTSESEAGLDIAAVGETIGLIDASARWASPTPG